MGEFSVNIIGLAKKAHEFKLSLGKSFFEEFGRDLLEEGQFEATVVLDKHETFIEGKFNLKGTARLVCDRSLESFDYPLEFSQRILFKFGSEEGEVSDDIVVISQDKQTLNLGQYLYEFIGISLPMKRIHPKYQEVEEENESEPGAIIYSSSSKDDGDEIDPRWEKLKKLK